MTAKDTSARGMLDETYKDPGRRLCEPADVPETAHDAARLPDHQPTLMRAAGPFGCWCICICGWSSDTEARYRTVMGAHAAFGRHLIDVGEAR